MTNQKSTLHCKIPDYISQALKNYTANEKGSLKKQSEVVAEALEFFLRHKGYITDNASG